MKPYILLLFTLFISPLTSAQTKPEVLTNASVSAMVKAGLENSVIITTIENGMAKFDVTSKGLIELKKQNIPDDIISVMVDKMAVASASSGAKPAAAKTTVSTAKVTLVNHPYVQAGKEAPVALEKATANMKQKMKGMGFGGASIQYELAGPASALRQKQGEEVSFLVNTAETALPEYILYKVQVKAGKRIAVSMDVVTGGGMKSTNNTISYDTTPVRKGLFKLTPSAKLEKGEYFFAVPPNAASATTMTVFAFGVD